MDWPEPPRWLAIIASIVIAPLWALFLLLWLVSDLLRGIGDLRRDDA